MAISKPEWDDIMLTVEIEMECMFTVLEAQYSNGDDAKALAIKNLEATLKKFIKTMDLSIVDTPPKRSRSLLDSK